MRSRPGRSLLATAYLQSYQDSLTYSTDELEAAYQEDRTAYDLVDCAYVRVNGAAADTDEEGNSIEVTDEMKAEAMARCQDHRRCHLRRLQGGHLSGGCSCRV